MKFQACRLPLCVLNFCCLNYLMAQVVSELVSTSRARLGQDVAG
jgi:hypothetical protein